jgi:hypothetical protein
MLLMAITAMAAQEVTHPQLRDELMAMRERDQKHRLPGQRDERLTAQADAANQSRLRAIVKEFGWPTLPMVGLKASQGAWLIVQHADNDLAFQQATLALITPLSEQGLVPKAHVAYLHDRVSKPQRFGTQGACVGKGKWEPREIADAALVEERRKSMGLEPLAEYVKMASEFLCSK